ncbi:hypothetical protein K4K57_006426 [Colletotrichum sp. SAR 10_99]|nr:hypothetical protein K4K56_003124 [Colletotrichum sp. SAR 10_98]KAJ5018105.1 hypothetical protein K4K57_006426 [Colletotrichum sp. SAR 10_99]
MAAKPFDEMKVNWITQPDPIGVATLGVTICLGAISLIVVIIRVWARQNTGALGLDDYLMIVGKRYRVILWTAMIASILSTTIGFIAVVAVCRPVSYTWDKSLDGSCAPTNIITSISYLISVMAIITDWTCAIVPTVVVCGLQMKSRVKASVCAVLALGAIASAATIIRLPYLQYYNVVEDYLHNIANIVLWSIFECGIGIIAGSLPSLRRLLKFWLDKSSKGSYNNTGSNPLHGDSGYQGSNGVKLNNLSGRAMTVSNCQTGNRDNWVQLDDDDNSQKHIIMKTQEVSVRIEMDNHKRHR